jgi:hypothetical protein
MALVVSAGILCQWNNGRKMTVCESCVVHHLDLEGLKSFVSRNLQVIKQHMHSIIPLIWNSRSFGS